MKMVQGADSTGSPMRVVEPFVLGELSAQKLCSGSHTSEGQQILKDLETWKSKMSELELRMLFENKQAFMPGLLETLDSFVIPNQSPSPRRQW